MLKIGKFYLIHEEEYLSLEDVFVIAPKFRELIEQTHGKALSLKSKAGTLEEKSVARARKLAGGRDAQKS